MREFSVDIGDHPCCTDGLPVCLGWDYEEQESVPIDDYERVAQRRHRGDLRQSAASRRQRLLEGNHDEASLKRAERQLNRSRSCHARLAERMQVHFILDDHDRVVDDDALYSRPKEEEAHF